MRWCFGASREQIRLHLAAHEHRVPTGMEAHAPAATLRGGAASGWPCRERIFAEGLCLPSGSALTAADQAASWS